jgi:hypothetical protein
MVKTALRFSMFSSHGLQRPSSRRFGKRQPFVHAIPAGEAPGFVLADDVRLFLTTFVGGLLFMTVYLA